MGRGVVEAYRDRCRAALQRHGVMALLAVWLRALVDSLRNGLGERMSPAIAWRRAGNWGRDSELVLRRMRRSPLFVMTVVAALTVGLGAFAVVYSAVHNVLLAPLPYERPDDLYFVWRNYTWLSLNRGWVGGPDVAAMQSAGNAIQAASGLRREARTLTSEAANDPEEVGVMLTSPNLFDLLGVRPVIGRGFAPGEVGPGRPGVAVLTDKIWRRRFGANPSVVGSQIRIDGQPYTVIGVMGPGFHFVRHASLGEAEGADIYTSFDYHLAERNYPEGSFAAIVRARPGTSAEVLASTIGAIGLEFDEKFMGKRGLRLYPVALKPDLVSSIRPALLILGFSGLALVLVLMINLATLLLERAARREREFAISRALGADRAAIVRAMVLEGGILGLLGGAGGALLAIWGTRALVALAPANLPQRDAIGVTWTIAAIVIATGVALGLLAGAAPAGWAARANLASLMGSTAVRGGGGHGRMRRGLVVAQVALSLILLTTGAVVARSLERLLQSDAGFNPDGVLTLRVPFSPLRYPDAAALGPLVERLHQEFAAIPGVSHVGAATALPLSADPSQSTIAMPGAPGNTGRNEVDQPLVDRIRVRHGYFETMRIPVLAGRTFDAQPPAGALEAVIDRTLAAQFYPNGNPLGGKVSWGNSTFTIIGVVEHARQYDLHKDGRPQVYFRSEPQTLSWALRTPGDPASLVADVRAVVRRVDPQLPLSDVRSMQELVGESIREQRLSATLVSGFSLATLVLATMGLFGVVSGAVTRRRHELAVRLALGAEQGQVVRLVLREGALLVLLGLLVAVPGIYFAGRLASGILVGISPFDPPTLAMVVTGLLAVTLVACYVPARRAVGIEPAGLLRRGH
jgi:putative ABC transport system permease protein